MAIEALVSIASGMGVECLVAETRADKAFLQDNNEITFSNEDMEVGYSDHRRPLYVATSINQILINRALVDTGALVNLIPLSTLQATGISKSKIQGCPMEVTGFGGKGKYTAEHIQLWLKVGPIDSLARFHMVKTEVSYHILLGRPWLHIHLSLVCEREIEWQDDMDSSKPIHIRTGKSQFGRDHVLRQMGAI